MRHAPVGFPRTNEVWPSQPERIQRAITPSFIFLLQSWSQSSEDIQFAYRIAESTKGRVFFTAGKDLDRFVVWDYLSRRRSIVS